MSSKRLLLIGLWSLGLVVFVLSPLYASERIAIRAEKIFTVSGDILENGIVLVEDGKIVEAGANVQIPEGVTVVEGEVLIPGLVDMHTHVGVYSMPLVEENEDGNEMTDPITPQVRALDSFNFDDPAIAAGRAGGVTTVISRPGSGNIIGGTSVAVKLKSGPADEMIVEEICDLKMTIEGNPIGVYGNKKKIPSTLMAVYHLAEKAFIEAQEYQTSWEKYEQKKEAGEEAEPPGRDLGKESIVMALKREIPVHIHTATASEIVSSIRFADQFNLRLSVCHGYYSHLLVDALQD